ncbi:FecR family protein [Sphingobacterium tabacisoli]|uniref:FecR family protein n=1 Tax=Sphingobacterium tabacisoli TaxID=2044855 RepID=A0ABW5L4X3_9SPHI|nr:FecR domain-containing protein [Sphingobacterium tabacisoli]
MNHKASEIARLLLDKQSNTLSDNDCKILDNWLNQSEENRQLARSIADPDYLLRQYRDYDKIIIPSPKTIAAQEETQEQRLPTRRIWIRYAAAIILFFTFTLFLWKSTEKPSDAAEKFAEVDNIYPAQNKATITLEDGRTLLLDQEESAIVIDQRKIAYADGSPLVDVEKSKNKSTWMTLTTPVGSTYHIILSDGTKVWLNASSRLRYPDHFEGNQRLVELSGEAYFEVHKDPHKPFKVRSSRQEIQVLGTQFNVAAYDDEPIWRTTLVEGSVQVSNNRSGKQQTLAPSQQAVLNNEEIIRKHVDVDTEISWKSGKFSFDNKSFDQIMKEMGRWYGFEVIYETEKPKNRMMGDAFRTDNLRAVLRFLNNSGIHYRMEKSDSGKQRLVISKRKEVTP